MYQTLIQEMPERKTGNRCSALCNDINELLHDP